MTRFGALLFLLLCLNIPNSEAQQCQEFKDGFKNYFHCILNCYKMHFGARFKDANLCTSEVTIDDPTSDESESGYSTDEVDLSFDCIVNQCISEVPPPVCGDSTTPADSTVSTAASTSNSDSTPSMSSTSITTLSGSTGSTDSSTSDKDVSINENQVDYEVDCEESDDAEAVGEDNASSASTTDTPTTNTDYSYEYYYSDEDYAESSANASSNAGNGKAEASADATSAKSGTTSASTSAQYQNNGNAQPQNNVNTQPQNNDKKGVDANMQNSNNGNGYSYYGNIPQSFAANGNNYNGKQINQEVPVSSLQYQNFGNQRSNQNQYYDQKPSIQPAYNQPQVTNQNSALQTQADNYNSNSDANASAFSGNGKTEANADAASANGGAASASASAQYQYNRNAQPQNNGNIPSQNYDKNGANTNVQYSNNGNGYSSYREIPQSVAGADNSGRQTNQQVPVSNLQYQNFGDQRNNQNQYYYQRPAVQSAYNQPQAIYQNAAFQPSAGGNYFNNQQALNSNTLNQAPFSNNAADYSSGYANNNGIASSKANTAGNNNLYGFDPGFSQYYRTADNDGSRSGASANSRYSANDGKADASAASFSSMSNSMSSGKNFNPSSFSVPTNSNGGPIKLNFGDDSLVIHGKQVQWHRNNQLVDSFAMN